MKTIPLGRVAETHELSDVITFLATASTGYVNVPAELASRFKFARQKSKLAGTIRGSYFAFENDY